MPQILYSPRKGRYLKANGKVAKFEDIQAAVDAETQRTRSQLRKLAQQQVRGRLTIDQWDRQFREIIRAAHYQVAAIAAGGESNITPLIRWQVDGLITQEYGYLQRFTEAINATETPPQIAVLNRAQRYANALKISFSRVEIAVRIAEGGWEGWRQLDPASDACPSCLKYRTPGFVPLGQIVAIGDECECRNNCACQILFRRVR